MSKLRTSILDLLWEMGGYGCHQIPERSFFYKGEQFPVCARCTGVVVGQFLCICTALVKKRFKNICYIFLLIPIGIDWLIQFIKIKESNNIRRFITGILGGYAVFGIYINFFSYMYKNINSHFKLK